MMTTSDGFAHRPMHHPADGDDRPAPPAAPTGTRPFFIRFFDSFLQERNIKWVLGIGVLILLGSSLMLVTTHWRQYTPVWKYLIMFGYTAGIAGAAHLAYHRMALRKTGTMLMALTVLLLPVLFLALHWVQGDAGTVLSVGELLDLTPRAVVHLGLLAATAVFTVIATRGIFKLLLHRTQPTFLLSYLLLCAAGAVAPLVPSQLAPLAALALWAVFAAGAVKVNRHVFWLGEEHRRPRIVGFFPILLLGGQFLTVFLLYLSPHVAVEWLGLGCALVAAPVLLTADAVARACQQRSGALRPLPWAVSLPLMLGLILCLAAMVLAGTGLLPPRSLYAMAPTAVLVAACMFATANRTNHRVFTWAALLAATVAYNFSPVFFQELARQVVQTGAQVVNEERLPYAFYGLTYLPLIAGLMAASAWLRRRRVLAAPMRDYTLLLSCLLLAVSTGHVKAMMPVSIVMALVFTVQTRMYRDYRIGLAGVIAFIMAAAGAAPFVERFFGVALPADASVFCLIGATLVLMTLGAGVDRALSRLAPAQRRPVRICAAAGLGVAVFVSAHWMLLHLATGAAFDMHAAATGSLLTGLLIAQSLIWRQPLLGGYTIVYAYIVMVRIATGLHAETPTVLSLLAAALLAQWLVAGLFRRAPRSRAAGAFALPAEMISGVVLTVAAVFLVLPQAIGQITLDSSFEPVALWWPLRIAVVCWLFDAARRYRSAPFATLGCAITLALTGAAHVALHGEAGWQWLPAVWSAAAVLAIPIAEWLRARAARSASVTTEHGPRCPYRAIGGPIDAFILAVLGAAAIGSLAVFTLPMRVAGGIALGGLIVLGFLRRQPAARVIALTLVNWQLIALLILLIGPAGMETIADLSRQPLTPIVLPIAALAAASLLLWQLPRTADALTRDIIGIHRAALLALSIVCIIASANAPHLPTGHLVLAAVTFAILAAGECVAACRASSETRVWTAQACLALGVLYFVHRGVIGLDQTACMFAALGIGAVASLLSRAAAQRPTMAILSRPLRQTALLMPAVAVVLGLVRHFQDTDPQWRGVNSLALLLAAGAYFWHGVERRRNWALLVAAAITNIAFLLLWHELKWSDPQFYLVPIGISIIGLTRLLRRDIPDSLRDPLYYLGALVVLVSPTFHIVHGSWAHLLSLMVLSVAVVLVAIGCRIRPLVYTGSAFLVSDLIAMVVRGSIDHPNLLWIAGIGVGAAVVTLGAIAERNRELLLQRLRKVSAVLDTWD